MKALHILKALANDSICIIKDKDDLLLVKDAVDELVLFLKEFKKLEALQEQFKSLDTLISERSLELRKANDKICELEALPEPKTCDTCKHKVIYNGCYTCPTLDSAVYTMPQEPYGIYLQDASKFSCINHQS